MANKHGSESGAAVAGAAHGSATVELQFMVVPELLATLAHVPDPVRCKITDPEAIFLTGLLGESGRKLVKAGIEFYFTRPLAEKLISKGIAVESPNVKGQRAGTDRNEIQTND